MNKKISGDDWIVIVIIMLMFGFPIMLWTYEAITKTSSPSDRCEPHWTSEGYVSDCTIEEARGEE